jgi:protein phosphatase
MSEPCLSPQPKLLRVVGDVHGAAGTFAVVAGEGRTAGRFILQLGDLVDRGPDSPGCLRLALSLRAEGAGISLRGNHDHKLARLLAGNPVKAGAELTRTRAAIEAAPDGVALSQAFLAAWSETPWWWLWGNYLFVHGAFHPAMLDHPHPRGITPGKLRKKAEWLALYGEGEMTAEDNLPTRTYNWVKTIPPGITVVLGHDVRCETGPLVVSNTHGGRAIFLDTGCGKGGPLTSLDLDGAGAEDATTRHVNEVSA